MNQPVVQPRSGQPIGDVVGAAPSGTELLLIDCGSCAARPAACGDCVVSVLLGPPPGDEVGDFDATEVAALAVLADSGLIPPLRLIT